MALVQHIRLLLPAIMTLLVAECVWFEVFDWLTLKRSIYFSLTMVLLKVLGWGRVKMC